MSRRTKILIGVSILVIVLLLAALLLLPRGTGPGTLNILPAGTTETSTGLPGNVAPNRGSTATAENAPGTTETTPTPAEPLDDTSALKRFASAFAERFGSFSNQTDFVNITDLAAFMTADFQEWAEEYVADARAQQTDTAVHAGTTTRALMAEVLAFDESDGTATVRVGTQRRKDASGTEPGEVYYQSIVIELVKVNGEWKADSATWQERQ
jgi:hypothetical protein